MKIILIIYGCLCIGIVIGYFTCALMMANKERKRVKEILNHHLQEKIVGRAYLYEIDWDSFIDQVEKDINEQEEI